MSAKEVFDLFNTTGSGISGAELGTALRAAGKAPSEEEITDLQAGKDIIDEAAFIQAVSSLESLDQPDVLSAFEVFDQNGNGYMSIQELSHVLEHLGEGMPKDVLDTLKKVAAPDEEGQVNIRHLVDVLMKTGN
eukprot:m.96810 g.96810  ORF g.96810 m.96810 type:complete len:134 (-) comp16669_c0_seq1:301-702(-)